MYQKISFMRKMIFFILILSNISIFIKSIEKISQWEINKKELEDPTGFGCSNIYSCAVDNSTNAIIFLGSEQNYSFIYLNKEIKIINPYPEILYSFESQLISYEKEFYFCSSKYLFKIDSEKNLIKIPPPEILTQLNEEWTLKCLYIKESQSIISIYKNTSYILSYNLLDLQINIQNSTNENSKIIDGNINYQPFQSDLLLSIIYEFPNQNNQYDPYLDPNEYSIEVYKYQNLNFHNIYRISLNYLFENQFEHHSEMLISFGQQNFMVIIFTYEPNTNEYNFYQIDIGKQSLELYSGNQYIRFMKNYQINSAHFIENSHLLYYSLTKNSENLNGDITLSKNYIGVVDLEHLISVYNIEMAIKQKIIFDSGNLYKNKAYLSYFDGGKHILICPFVFADNSCTYYSQQYFTITFESSLNIFQNSFSDSCINKMAISHFYCGENCPTGYFNDSNWNCILCSGNMYYHYASKSCLYDCDNENFPSKNYFCYNCKTLDMVFYENECYDNCQELSGIVSQEDPSKCTICKSLNKIYFNDSCVDDCEPGYGITTTDINGLPVSYCQKCKDDNLFYYNKKCISQCPPHQIADENNFCFYCNELNKEEIYYEDGKCVSSCSKGYELILSSAESNSNNNPNDNYCFYCKNENLFYSHNKTCEKQCEKNSFFFEESNICYYCYEINQYYQNGSCVNECSRGFGSNLNENKEEKICEFCFEKKMFYLRGGCEKKCDENLAWNETDNICVNCGQELNLFFENNKCVSSCSRAMRIFYQESICLPCPEDKKFYSRGECVEKCPDGSILHIGDKFCEFCPDNTFFQEGKCVTACAPGYVEKENRICKKCGFDNKSWYNGRECVEDCGNNRYAANDHFCRACFCGFDETKCAKFSDECICSDKEHIFGKNCELYSQNKKSIKKLEIIPANLNNNYIVSTDKNYFTFKLNTKENIDLKNYIISWKFYQDRRERTKEKKYEEFFTTGAKDEFFGINSKLLSNNYQYNNISLSIINKENKTKIFEDEISIKIQEVGNNEMYIKVDYLDDTRIPMESTYIINFERFNEQFSNKYYYQIGIVDYYKENITLTPPIYLENLQKENGYRQTQMVLPFCSMLNFYLISERGEIQTFSYRLESDIDKAELILLDKILLQAKYKGYTDVEKIFALIVFFLKNKQRINDYHYEQLTKFINEKILHVINENGYYQEMVKDIDPLREPLCYYEPKTLFSLINHIIQNQKEYIKEKNIKAFLNIIKNTTDNALLIKNNQKTFSQSDFMSLFRTFDQLMYIYYTNKEKNEVEEIKKICNEIIDNLMIFINKGIYPSETIRIVGKNVTLVSTGFGKFQNILSFASIKTKVSSNDYRTYSFDNYYLNTEKCSTNNQNILCIKQKHFEEFKQKLILKKIDINDLVMSFCLFDNFNNNNKNSENNYGEFLFRAKIYNKKLKKYFDIEDYYISPVYEIEFNVDLSKINSNSNKISIKNNKNSTLKKLLFTDFDHYQNNYSSITCIPKNHIRSKDKYCLTHFNYKRNTIKCSCNVLDEIIYINNQNLSNFYKSIQYPEKKIYLLNKQNLTFLFIFILSLLIPIIFYLIYDIIKDKFLLSEKAPLDLETKRKKYYNQIKYLSNTNILIFALFITLNQFPFFAPFCEYSYDNPKFLKHIIIFVSIFCGIILSIIPFVFSIPFYDRQKMIDIRDDSIENEDIYNIGINFYHFNLAILFSIGGTIITNIIIYVVSYILDFIKKDNEYWRNIKIMFSDYIYNEIKGNVLLNESWHRVKKRMDSFYKLCGKYILSQSIYNHPDRNKKLEEYLKYMNKDEYVPIQEIDSLRKIKKNKSNHQKQHINLNLNSDSDSLLPPKILNEEKDDSTASKNSNQDNNNSINIDDNNNNNNSNRNDDSYIPPLVSIKPSENIPNENLNINNIFMMSHSNSNINSKKTIIKSRRRSKSLSFYFLIITTTDNFQLFGHTFIKRNPTINKNKKFEQIKYKYIYSRIRKSIAETEIDNSSNFNLANSLFKIIHQINFTYLDIEDYLLLKNKNNASYYIIRRNKKPQGYNKVVGASIILSLVFMALIGVYMWEMKKILEKFGYSIALSFGLISVLCEFVGNICFYYGKSVIGSVLLFKSYQEKNRGCYNKIVFWIFTNKSMVRIYKIRNYITKYKNEFDYS